MSGSGSRGNTWSNNNYGSHDNSYRPTNTYNTNSGYGSSGSYHPGSYVSHTYYHYPQHVYVTQYRDSGSRYGDLLTGLTFYNLGRSQSHYHDHYYYDDYYRTRYNSPSSSGYRTDNQPRDEATCTLRIKENGKLQLLKIPCEIVSTFTEGSQKVNNPSEALINKTVCTTNTTVIKRIAPENVSVNITTLPTAPAVNATANVSATNVTSTTITTGDSSNVNMTNLSAVVSTVTASNVTNPVNVTNTVNSNHMTGQNVSGTNGTVTVSAQSVTTNATAEKATMLNGSHITIEGKTTEGNKTTHTVRVLTSTEEIVNVTICTTTSTVDPLSVKGPPINPSAMECAVDIKTKNDYFRNKVDCQTLMKYSKMPPPKKDPTLLPERQKLKSWLEKPPWWMSMFIAV